LASSDSLLKIDNATSERARLQQQASLLTAQIQIEQFNAAQNLTHKT